MKAIRILIIVVIILGTVVALSIASLGQVHVARLGQAGVLHQWLVERGVQAIQLAQRAVRGSDESQAPMATPQPTPTAAPATRPNDARQASGTPPPEATPTP